MPPLTDKAASFARTETEEGSVGDVPEMVERVARALCEAQGCRWEDQSNPLTSANGDDDTTYYYHAARAAIAAMREPTEAVLDAGWLEEFEDAWPLAIDAALGNTEGAR